MSDKSHGFPGEKYGGEQPPSIVGNSNISSFTPSPSLQRASHESQDEQSFVWPGTLSSTHPDHQPTQLDDKEGLRLRMFFVGGFGLLLFLAGIGAYTVIASHVSTIKPTTVIIATQPATQMVAVGTATKTSEPSPTPTTASSGVYPSPATFVPTVAPIHAPTATLVIINKGVYVDANIPPNGVDTGIHLLQGARVSLQASGLGTYFGVNPILLKNTCDYLPYTDPDGNRYPNQNKSQTCGAGFDATATLPAKPVGTLIGRIGTNGAWFGVGSSADFTASQSGEFYLIYNDSASTGLGYSDNSGGYDTSIHVTQS